MTADTGVDLPPVPEDIDLTDDDTALAHVLRRLADDREPVARFANQI